MVKIIEDFNDPDVLNIIKQLKTEPCLYDPDVRFFKNAKKRKEAYQRITEKVNRHASTEYTVEDVMANVKNLRNEFGRVRKKRMQHYTSLKKLNPAPEWWRKLYSTIKDQIKITHMWVHESENIKEVKQRVENDIRRYTAAENEYIRNLHETSEDEDVTPYSQAGSANDDPPAKKQKTTDEPNTASGELKRPPSKKQKTSDELYTADGELKLIKSVHDFEAALIIRKLHNEACLVDSEHKFYKNKREREKACKRIADKINSFDDELAFTAADVAANIKILKDEYHKCRQKRIRYYALKKKLPPAEKWWRNLYHLILDDKHYEEDCCLHTSFTKAQIDKKIQKLSFDYKKYEERCQNGEVSFDEEKQTADEIMKKTSCSLDPKKFCLTTVEKEESCKGKATNGKSAKGKATKGKAAKGRK